MQELFMFIFLIDILPYSLTNNKRLFISEGSPNYSIYPYPHEDFHSNIQNSV